MLKKGDVLQNRYRILDHLGEGGMGAVYRAEDTKRFNKTVALKEVLGGLTSKNSEHFRRAFEREAKILIQIEHEAVPKVVDYFIETDCQFLVMELIEGEDLTSILEKRKTWFPVENVLNWTNQLLDALDYLHTLTPPIIHRDIKPQNLKLTSRGKIKLLDFGIAKDTDAELAATLTDHTFIGATLHYSPFEQLVRLPFYYEPLRLLYGEKVERVMLQSADARSDIYSLGATLYHLLTNVEPFGAYHRTLEVWAGKFDPLLPPHKIVTHISPEISAVLLKAMEIERENRFGSALEMKTALQEIFLLEKQRDYEENQAVFFTEQKKLRVEREELEAERQIFKIQHEESLRQIAAERELQRLEKEEKERENQLFEVERMRLEAQKREHRQLEEEETKSLAHQRLEAERREGLLQIQFERERQKVQEREIEHERQKLEQAALNRERQRLEEEAEKEREREELEAERRKLEAEKRWLKVQHEESLRQIAAERERVQFEGEVKERELGRLENERQRIEQERKKLEEEEQSRERQRLEEEAKKEREREELEAEEMRLESERQKLEKEKRAHEQKELEEKEKKQREREELETKKHFEAEEAEKEHQIFLKLEHQKLEDDRNCERQLIEEERERQKLEAESKENLRLIALERAREEFEEKQQLAGQERERLKSEERELAELEAERQQLEAEAEIERERQALEKEKEKERELQAAFVTRQIASAKINLPAEENIEPTAAQISRFVTRTSETDSDWAEKTEKISLPETIAPFYTKEIESDDDILEIESEKNLSVIESAPVIQEIEVESERRETTPVSVAVADKDEFLPGFAAAPPGKKVWMLPLVVIGLLIFGVAAFGMWMMFGNSENAGANNSVTNINSPTSTPTASPTVEPSVLTENEPTPVPTQTTSERPKPTVAPAQNKTPVQTVKTPPPVKIPKPTQDPNCVFTNSCK